MMDIFDTVVGVVLSAVAAAIGWIWTRIDGVHTMVNTHVIKIQNLEEAIDDHKKLPERIASLEATMTANMQAIMNSLKDLKDYVTKK